MSTRQLEPSLLWKHFNDLNAVPRPSKKEERVIQFMIDFAARIGLPCDTDEVGNVKITKPATPGMENRKTVVLQSHLDMVHQKNNDTVFDFDTQGIEMYVDGDWVRARGTTLGADNGIGVAAIMAVLERSDIAHPPIEALFTIDEETGMTGAKSLKPNWIKGEVLLNLDTEEDDEIDIGCAGGIDTTATLDYKSESPAADSVGIKVVVSGLKGGHSGMDIHKGHGNANKWLVRLLLDTEERFGLRLARFDGGGLRNAIPREASAELAVLDVSGFKAHIGTMSEKIAAEFGSIEPNLNIGVVEVACPKDVVPLDTQQKILAALMAMPNSVFRMSPDMEDLVETSSNLARVIIEPEHFEMHSLQRSSVESTKDEIAAAVRSVFMLMGADVTHSGSYPGWKPNPNSAITELLVQKYRQQFNEEPQVVACHAGLECGLIGEAYPQLDMISFGPTIRGAHSPDERVSISSVQKFWGYLVEILKDIPLA